MHSSYTVEYRGRERIVRVDVATPDPQDPKGALRAVLAAEIPEDLKVNRIEIRPMGTGEVAYRLWPRDGSDYVGGVVTDT